MILFKFSAESDISKWNIINDTVMGGRSDAEINISPANTGIFKGHVSLENNGGFAMVQYRFDTLSVEDFDKAIIKLKGDGKSYQFRIKTQSDDKHSYISSFQTSGEWETITVSFADMYPAFRGKKLKMENYPGKKMELIAFLIGNKKEESFQLEIDSINLI